MVHVFTDAHQSGKDARQRATGVGIATVLFDLADGAKLFSTAEVPRELVEVWTDGGAPSKSSSERARRSRCSRRW